LKRQFLKAAAAALLVIHAGASLAQSGSNTSKPVRIGFIGPLTGASTEMGTASRLGAELAISEINQAGGYLGRNFELVVRDDKANPDEGLRAAQDLVLNEKVDFTLGFSNSGVAFRALDTFQEHKHLLLVPVATATAITTKIPPKDSYVFRLSVPDVIQAGALVDDALKQSGRIAVFADTSGYGEAGFKDVVKLLEDRQVRPVHTARFAVGVKSLTDEVRKAKAAGADVIICYAVAPEWAVLASSRVEAGFRGRLYGPWGASHRAVVDRAGVQATEGIVMVQSIIQDWANERRSSFILRLKRQAGQTPVGTLMAAAQTYDAVHLMLYAMFQTHGNTSGPVLKAALENLARPYAGVVTTYAQPFTANDHEAYTRNMAWLGVWDGGEVKFLYPQEARLSAMVRRKQGASDSVQQASQGKPPVSSNASAVANAK
jgi:branched-chain amino acid transport system substrate-binding protein